MAAKASLRPPLCRFPAAVTLDRARYGDDRQDRVP